MKVKAVPRDALGYTGHLKIALNLINLMISCNLHYPLSDTPCHQEASDQFLRTLGKSLIFSIPNRRD